MISDLADIIQKCVKSSLVTIWLNNCSLSKSIWMNKLKKRQEVLGKIKKLRSNNGKRDISGSNLRKIEEFIEKGNISHLSIEEIISTIILQLNFFLA